MLIKFCTKQKEAILNRIASFVVIEAGEESSCLHRRIGVEATACLCEFLFAFGEAEAE